MPEIVHVVIETAKGKIEVELDQHAAPITVTNFLRCFERVLDLVPSDNPTELVNLARSAGVPATHGDVLNRMQEDNAREMWIREYKRNVNGEADEPRAARKQGSSSSRRKPMLKKRNG